MRRFLKAPLGLGYRGRLGKQAKHRSVRRTGSAKGRRVPRAPERNPLYSPSFSLGEAPAAGNIHSTIFITPSKQSGSSCLPDTLFSQPGIEAVSFCVLALRNDIARKQRHDFVALSYFNWPMKQRKDKLKSTTVRFTREDLQIIEELEQRLGLGMVQVIRLAIRRLAQLENIRLEQT